VIIFAIPTQSAIVSSLPGRPLRPDGLTVFYAARLMKAFNTEKVLSVQHWNDTLFSFKTTRDPGLRFRNGHFVMVGLEVEGRPRLRHQQHAGRPQAIHSA